MGHSIALELKLQNFEVSHNKPSFLQVRLLPLDKQKGEGGRYGFASSQLSTIGRYREQAAALHEEHAAGHLEEFEYRARLKVALANALWASNEPSSPFA